MQLWIWQLSLLMKRENMYVMQECGGLLKINWLIWNRFAQFQNIVIEDFTSAALSELYRRTKELGATHMTGGFNDFYKAIGYKPAEKWTYWKKQQSKIML